MSIRGRRKAAADGPADAFTLLQRSAIAGMTLPNAVSTGTKRREDRVFAEGTVICRRGANRQPVQLADLSRSGMRLKTTLKLHVDERVWLKLPMLEPLEARVVWVKGFEAGCEFLVALHPAVFEALSRTV